MTNHTCELSHRGLFTYYLLQGLKQQKDASIATVYRYVQAQVAREASANGWKQHPVFSASDGLSTLVLSVAPLATGWLGLEPPVSYGVPVR